MLALLPLLLGKITRSQIYTVLVLGLVAVLAGGIAFALAEHVSVGTGLYWAVTTATTVGYGDVTPHNGVGRVVAVLVMVTAIPLFGAAFALFAAAATAARLDKYLRMRHPYAPGSYVVLLGMHPTVPLVLRQIHEAGGSAVIVADVDSTTLPTFVHHIAGSPTDEQIVAAARPGEARAVLLVTPDDGDMLVAAVLLRHLAPDVPAVAIAQSTKVAEALADLGIARTISTEELLGQTLAKSLEAPHAADVLLGMLGGDGYRMEELPVDATLAGGRLRALGDRVDGLVLGIVREGRVVLAVADDPELRVGDQLVRLVADVRPQG